MTLTQILQKIRSAFYTKAETDTLLGGKIGKPDGLNGQILTQNNNKITSENPIQLLNLVNTQEDLNNALTSVPLTLQDVFNNWYRFAHSSDTVQNDTTANGVQDALNAWYYDSSLSAIGNTVNTTPYVGFVSDKTYKNWYMKTKGIGTDIDDDQMSIIVSFMTDSNGYEHTLSVIRSGARDNGQLTGTDGVSYSFALVLDYNTSRWNSAKVLAGIPSSQLTGSPWSKGSHISVRRNGNTITAKTSQFGSDNLNIEFTYTVPTSQGSLSAADYTNIRLMLNNKSKIGFGMCSQPGYFILEETEGIFDNTDIYDVLNNKIYTYNNGWVQNGTVSSKVLNLSRIYNEKTDKLFYYKDEEVYQLNTSSSEIDLSDYATKSELLNKANDSDVVHRSGNETINGTKTFTASPFVSNSATTNGYFIKNTAIGRNEVPTQLYHATFRAHDKNDKILGEYCVEKSTTGCTLLNMNVRSEDSNGKQLSESVYLNMSNDGSAVRFHPSSNNKVDLGTFNQKWAKIYSDDVVHTSGNETINGVKSFTANICKKNSALDLQVNPSSDQFNSFLFTDKNNAVMGYLEHIQTTTGVNAMGLYAKDKSNKTHGFQVTSEDNVIPLGNGVVNLGLSGAKWKNVYATTFNGNLKGNADTATSANSVAWANVTGKPSIPTTPNVYVTATWASGSNWYRKWSNGFIEQGGVDTGVNLGNAGGSITLPIPFSNANYIAMLTPSNFSREVLWIGNPPVRHYTSTATTLKWGAHDGIGGEVCWYACGY